MPRKSKGGTSQSPSARNTRGQPETSGTAPTLSGKYPQNAARVQKRRVTNAVAMLFATGLAWLSGAKNA